MSGAASEPSPARPSRSVWLLDAHAGVLDRAVGMRFAREVGAGSLTPRVWARYLHIEEQFVRTAARLHGLAVWDAPRWDDAVRSGRMVCSLITEQADYFRLASAADLEPARLSAAGSAAAATLPSFATAAARAGGHAVRRST